MFDYWGWLDSTSGREALKIFLPPEALEGEEIPSFATWHDVSFERIEVKFPDSFEVPEIYNEDQKVEAHTLSVAHVEVNGHLELLFKTRRLETISEKVDVNQTAEKSQPREQSQLSTGFP